MTPTTRRILVASAKLLLLAIVAFAAHRTIGAAIAGLRSHGWELNQLHAGWLLLCGLLYLASQVPCGIFWHAILGAMHQPVTLLRALRAYFIGHLGKYVPGKAMVVVLRTALLVAPGVRPSLAAVAVFYETFTTMACGAVVAAIILLLVHRDNIWLIVGSLALALVVGLPTLPAIFGRLITWMRLTPADPAASTEPIHISPATLVFGWLTIAGGWFLGGASLCAAARSIGVADISLGDLPLLTAAFALAVVTGFVSLLPAGLGVRDIALMQLLAPRFGDTQALVAVLVLRLVSITSELVVAAILYPLARSTEPRQG